jgi:hypothetical protein
MTVKRAGVVNFVGRERANLGGGNMNLPGSGRVS